jgi:hypothetical protein
MKVNRRYDRTPQGLQDSTEIAPHDSTGTANLRRSQAKERMKQREMEKQRQRELDVSASQRSLQRRSAASEIARAKRGRVLEKQRQQDEKKRRVHEAMGSKIQAILDQNLRWAEKSNSVRVLGGESQYVTFVQYYLHF